MRASEQQSASVPSCISSRGGDTSKEIGAILALKRDLKIVRANLRNMRTENDRLRSILNPLLVGWVILSAEKSKGLSQLGVSNPNELLRAIGQYDDEEFSKLLRSIGQLAGAA